MAVRYHQHLMNERTTIAKTKRLGTVLALHVGICRRFILFSVVDYGESISHCTFATALP